MRATNFIFTVSIGGEERALVGVSGVGNEIDVVQFTESDRAPIYTQPGKLSGANITLRGVPFKLWEKEGPLASFFQVYVEGALAARCRRVSGLGVKINVFESTESDNIIKHKMPGHLAFNEVTLTQIVDSDDKLLAEWAKSIGYPTGPGDGFATGSALLLEKAKKNVDIFILARDLSPIASVKLLDCWPSRWSLADLDTTSEDMAIQDLTLQVNGYIESNMGDDEFSQWIASALKCKPEKRTLVIRAYERCAKIGADDPVATWKVINAFPAEIGFADLDAGATDVWLREVVVANEGVIPVPS